MPRAARSIGCHITAHEVQAGWLYEIHGQIWTLDDATWAYDPISSHVKTTFKKKILNPRGIQRRFFLEMPVEGDMVGTWPG